MYCGRHPSFVRSTTFRLTWTYTVLFSASSLVLLAGIYFLLRSSLLKQADSMLLAEINELTMEWNEENPEEMLESFRNEARAGLGEEVYCRILFADGREPISTNSTFWQTLPVTPKTGSFLTAPHSPHAVLISARQRYPVRLYSGPLSDGISLQVGRSMRNNIEVLARYKRIAGAMLFATFIPASLAGWAMSRRAMSGVIRVAQTAQKVEAGDLTQRTHLTGRDDEIDLLARSFNTMIERIQVLLTEWKEISNNIAHDLRSPITRIRGMSEGFIAHNTSTEGCELAGSVIEECDRLIGIINTMLEIAETESGTRTPALTLVSMQQIAADACDLFLPAAEDKQITLTPPARETAAFVLGETASLQRIVANLIDNAIKYTPSCGRVRLELREQEEWIELKVSDTGIGLSEEDCARIFNRFYRADPSRSLPGNGLGLSLARAIAHACGGEMTVHSKDGQGSCFILRLPRAHSDTQDHPNNATRNSKTGRIPAPH